MRDFILTSEAVTAGHPDKLCDQVSDAVVDACLVEDPAIGCVAECAMASGLVFLSIRQSRPLPFDAAALARRVLAGRGQADMADPGRTTVILDTVDAPELPGRRSAETMLPGQMTTAFGYARADGPAMMPPPIEAAHRIAAGIDRAAGSEATPWLGADAQVQVAVRFADRRAVSLEGAALAVHCLAGAPEGDALTAALRSEVVEPALAALDLGADGEELPLAPGALTVRRLAGAGGPGAHAGLTGRKAADDGYGGYVRQGTSALSGKDPSRIDRVAAYAARQAAVSAIAAGLAGECEVQLSWVSGQAGPVSVEVDSFGSGSVPDAEISRAIASGLDLRFGAVVDRLGLWDLPRARGGTFYRALASYGQVGRPEMELPWDRPLPLG